MQKIIEGNLFQTEAGKSNESSLLVIPFQAKTAMLMQPDSLFAGFTHIRLITFSFSKSLILRLAKTFTDIEIIFGEERLTKDIEGCFLAQAVQGMELQKLSQAEQCVAKKMQDGSMRFFVTKLGKHTSHEKYYLLQNPDAGTCRVITGSANFSHTAFHGQQFENIMMADDTQTYAVFQQQYEKTKQYSTTEYSFPTIQKLTKENLGKVLPMVSQIQETEKAYLMNSPEEEEVEHYLVQKDTLKKLLADGHIDLNQMGTKSRAKDKPGAILITAKKVEEVGKKLRTFWKTIREKETDYPNLYYNRKDGLVYFRSQPFLASLPVLAPEALPHDIQGFLDFFQGFSKASGMFQGKNQTGDIRKFFATTNFIFAAPFLSVFRAMTEQAVDIKAYNYPQFLFLKGASSAGKSSLVEFILSLCFSPYQVNIKKHGSGIMRTISDKDTTPQSVQEIRAYMQGMPFVIDEMNTKRWGEYADKFIKTDTILAEHISPLILISNTKVRELKPEEAKRTIFFSISMQTAREENYGTKASWRRFRPTGALYREYIRRMEQIVPKLLESMADTEAETPDLLKASADTLKAILLEYLKEHEQEIPDYLQPEYSITYYMFSHRKEVVQDFKQNAVLLQADCQTDFKRNQLTIDCKEVYTASDFINQVSDLLPPGSVQQFGSRVKLPLKETEKAFGLHFGGGVTQMIRRFFR